MQIKAGRWRKSDRNLRQFSIYDSNNVGDELHGPSMLPDKAKFVECSINSLALSFLDETSSYWSITKKLLNSRLFIGHHLEVRLSLVSFWEPAG